jgi:cyclic pyranopterin phosphate synthase
MALIDQHGRKISYLRLSVTDRCNLRCTYCMPPGGVELIPRSEVLSFEELLRVAAAAVTTGIEKIRVTGGEPLVRKGLSPFLAQLSRLPGLRELVLTSNGILLAEQAAALKAAGVQRLNISLDSLCPATFAAITRGGDLAQVWAGIAVAEELGLPVKVNMVVMRGVNDQELLDFAALTLKRKIAIRFIEQMPTVLGAPDAEGIVSGSEILARLGQAFELQALTRGERCGPAQTFRIAGAVGSLGLITPISGHFCGDCNRLRISAAGVARSCLFGNECVDLKPALANSENTLLERTLRELVAHKPARHQLQRVEETPTDFAMAKIGG